MTVGRRCDGAPKKEACHYFGGPCGDVCPPGNPWPCRVDEEGDCTEHHRPYSECEADPGLAATEAGGPPLEAP